VDGNPRAQLLLRSFSNVTQRDHRHVICVTWFTVGGKLGQMITEVSKEVGAWCRLQTEEPVKQGNVLTATIIGVRNNPEFDGRDTEQPAIGARGREIVAWRGIDGILQLCEARCPHQFVHLASSGTVDGCELVCTAHFWRFAATGEGSLRDSNGQREPVSALIVFPSIESDDELWGYFPHKFFVVEP
jgi:nitrite reductase/ring-hydroxylating ferredoxin subunit